MSSLTSVAGLQAEGDLFHSGKGGPKAINSDVLFLPSMSSLTSVAGLQAEGDHSHSG
jgi:hypothetical protein